MWPKAMQCSPHFSHHLQCLARQPTPTFLFLKTPWVKENQNGSNPNYCIFQVLAMQHNSMKTLILIYSLFQSVHSSYTTFKQWSSNPNIYIYFLQIYLYSLKFKSLTRVSYSSTLWRVQCQKFFKLSVFGTTTFRYNLRITETPSGPTGAREQVWLEKNVFLM